MNEDKLKKYINFNLKVKRQELEKTKTNPRRLILKSLSNFAKIEIGDLKIELPGYKGIVTHYTTDFKDDFLYIESTDRLIPIDDKIPTDILEKILDYAIELTND